MLCCPAIAQARPYFFLPALQAFWWDSVFPLLAEKPTADKDTYNAIAAAHAPGFLEGNDPIRYLAVCKRLNYVSGTIFHKTEVKHQFIKPCNLVLGNLSLVLKFCSMQGELLVPAGAD